MSFAADGAAHYPAILNDEQVAATRAFLEPLLDSRPGRRLTELPSDLLSPLTRIAAGLIGEGAFPVRAVAFDKTPETNWSVAWHQDRTVAVQSRIEVKGFGPWSTKDGQLHVAPPVEVLQGMVTLRLHVDDCDDDNAPLKAALGTHRLGVVAANKAAEVAAAHPIEVCHAAAGDVWAYATLILHASERSRSAGRRRVLQVDYAAADLPGGLKWQGLGGI